MYFAHSKRRGVALLLSLAILAVLAILATTFTRLMIMENNAATNYVASARADALANAGIDYALGQLQRKARKYHWAWFDNASREDEEAAGTTRVASSQRWVYRMRVVDSLGSGYYYDTLGAGLPLESCDRAYGQDSGTIFGIPSYYKGHTGYANKTGTDPTASGDFDPILLQMASPGELDTYDVFNLRIKNKSNSFAISGWIGNAMSNSGGGPSDAFIAGTFEDWGDTFSLKILDCSSMINVNMDTAYITEFLNLLGEELDNFWRNRFKKTTTRSALPSSVSESARSTAELSEFGYHYFGFRTPGLISGSGGLGTWLIGTVRDAGGSTPRVINSKEEIYTALKDLWATAGSFPVSEHTGEPLSAEQTAAEEWNKLKDFVTCYGYLDRRVIKPGSLMTAELYSLDVDKGGRHEARTPINMNTVSQPVLVAWLRGISYHRYEERKLALGDATSVISYFSSKPLAEMRKLAWLFRRVTYFTPVAAWKGMHSLIHGNADESQMGDVPAHKHYRDAFLAQMVACGFDQYDRDAWLAMADPNTMLNKFNPEWTIRRVVDKYDLRTWTTEMSFNSMGYFEIYSLGRITANGGIERASRKIRGVYQVFDMIFPTTQRDFELNRQKKGYDQVAGKEDTLHKGEWWGIISMPEYRNRFLDYEEGTATVYPRRGAAGRPGPSYDVDPAAASTFGYVATYDGYLCFNTLHLQRFYEEDFGVSFAYPLFKNPETGKNALDGIRKVGTASRYIRTGVPFEGGSARSVSGSARLRMARESGTGPLDYAETTGGGAAALTRFNDGSDAFPMGFFSDALRKRALAYPGTVYTNPDTEGAGAIQFWVKPRFAGREYVKSTGGDATDPGDYTGATHDRIDSWFFWEDVDGKKIWVYFKNNIVHFYFSNASTLDRMLYYDPSLNLEGQDGWKPGEWHHIHVDFGREGRVFIDGQEATSGGFRISDVTDTGTAYTGDFVKPEARHLEMGEWPSAAANAMKTFYAYPVKYKTSIDWVERHIPRSAARFTTGGTQPMWLGYGVPSKHHASDTLGDSRSHYYANATIDNVVFTTWRVFDIEQVQMSPDTFSRRIGLRYYPHSFREASRSYWANVTSEISSYDRDISLGSLAWTNYHPSNAFVFVYLQVDDETPAEAAAG